jgi:hypothetical protein
MPRTAAIRRATAETQIELALDLDGSARAVPSAAASQPGT